MVYEGAEGIMKSLSDLSFKSLLIRVVVLVGRVGSGRSRGRNVMRGQEGGGRRLSCWCLVSTFVGTVLKSGRNLLFN